MNTKELIYSLIDKMNDKQPNEETAEALREVEDMKKNPEKYKGYDDADLMFKELSA